MMRDLKKAMLALTSTLASQQPEQKSPLSNFFSGQRVETQEEKVLRHTAKITEAKKNLEDDKKNGYFNDVDLELLTTENLGDLACKKDDWKLQRIFYNAALAKSESAVLTDALIVLLEDVDEKLATKSALKRSY